MIADIEQVRFVLQPEHVLTRRWSGNPAGICAFEGGGVYPSHSAAVALIDDGILEEVCPLVSIELPADVVERLRSGPRGIMAHPLASDCLAILNAIGRALNK